MRVCAAPGATPKPNAPVMALDAKQMKEARDSIASHLRSLESTLETCEVFTASEVAALLACRLADVPARLSKMREEASFFRSVLNPVVVPVTEISPEPLPSEWSARLNTPRK